MKVGIVHGMINSIIATGILIVSLLRSLILSGAHFIFDQTF